MRVWTCTDFTGHWPVGVAAVVVAETAEQAAAMLSREVSAITPQAVDVASLVELDTRAPCAVILNDGDY